MYRKLFFVSVGFCIALSPSISHADEVKDDIASHEERLDGLQHTQQRLNELIKAAVKQNLVDVSYNSPLSNAETKPVQKSNNKLSSTASQACGTDTFSFPPQVKSITYDDLESLKSQVIINGDEIDPAKLKVLALAYIGLGFGEEALLASTTLAEPQQTIVRSQATTLLGTISASDLDFIRAQALCNESAQIWLDVLSAQKAPLTDEEIRQLQKRLSVLPRELRNIFGQRLGLKALKVDDIKTAKALYKTLIKQAPEHPETHKKLMSTDLKFFEAMLSVKNKDEQQKKLGVRKLKAFATKDNPYQVEALQALSNYLAANNDQQGGNGAYSGYEQDLDAAAQTYSQDEKGKQALAQKINFLAQNHELYPAIALAKESFERESHLFDDSVVAISRYVYSDLNNSNANIKLKALDILTREAAFFSGLEDTEDLRHAGVTACAKLELPKLAAKIMPMNTWQELDTETLTLLALSFGQDLRKQEIASAFPKQVLMQDEFKAMKIEQAFAGKEPGVAMKILSSSPKNDIVQNAFITHAWSAGYWSLVDKGVRAEIQNNKLQPNTSVQQILTVPAQNLAATLSTNAPVLPATSNYYGINELTSLQQYLENDLGVFKKYLSSTSNEITKTTNG